VTADRVEDLRSVRLVVHAMDRTGPAHLALAFADWLARAHPGIAVSFVAFRGGAMAPELATRWPVEVLLRDQEPWDVAAPDPLRVEELRGRVAGLGPVGVNLLVSVAAGQVLPLLGVDQGPIVTWSVELGADLHWLDDALDLPGRTAGWLAGSMATQAELGRRGLTTVALVPEFVSEPPAASGPEVAAARTRLGVGPAETLVLGAGIGTARKGVDLFAEVALAHRRRGGTAWFVWIGGERDPLPHRIGQELGRPGFERLVLIPSLPDLASYVSAADVFLHTARLDAFPLVCLQAALQGTPVVNFSSPWAVEMFGPTTIDARYPDVAELARRVEELAEEHVRATTAAAQRAHVRDRFTADAAAPALLEHLRLANAHSACDE
jgi:glycosyltransferase involved in cell wall biosynthesis